MAEVELGIISMAQVVLVEPMVAAAVAVRYMLILAKEARAGAVVVDIMVRKFIKWEVEEEVVAAREVVQAEL
ncbi:MAG: hypothetical protein EBS91_10025, partial [Betaproteobacteria bacterium]|nr:hypothetical protein [Betaproteobacteria bacterium]